MLTVGRQDWPHSLLLKTLREDESENNTLHSCWFSPTSYLVAKRNTADLNLRPHHWLSPQVYVTLYIKVLVFISLYLTQTKMNKRRKTEPKTCNFILSLMRSLLTYLFFVSLHHCFTCFLLSCHWGGRRMLTINLGWKEKLYMKRDAI